MKCKKCLQDKNEFFGTCPPFCVVSGCDNFVGDKTRKNEGGKLQQIIPRTKVLVVEYVVFATCFPLEGGKWEGKSRGRNLQRVRDDKSYLFPSKWFDISERVTINRVGSFNSLLLFRVVLGDISAMFAYSLWPISQ